VCVVLSAAQVEQVVRAASDGGRMSVLLSGLGDLRAVFAAGLEPLEDERLSHSLLCGLLMLASLPADGSYVSVREFARPLNMSPSTTYRYLSTLAAVGLVQRDPHTRRYKLADAG
jgi:DNA-binding transcriptional ArsR family regulator